MTKLFIFSFLLLVGCRENSKTSKKVLENTTNREIKEIHVQPSQKVPQSFVISCGSGCAMTYHVETVHTSGMMKTVKFNVDSYIDEKLSETNQEVYLFYYNKVNKIEKIQHEGETENLLQNLLPNAAASFRDFANSLTENINGEKLSSGEELKTQYQIDGKWMINCENGVGNITISGKETSVIILYNQIYIDMIELKKFDFENGISYKLKEIPDDVGNIGRKLNWKEYVNDKPIVYIKMIDNKTLYFYWYGFYNKKTKKREFKEINFQQECNDKEIILKKCS